jgi:hypothetical protein
MLGQLFYMLNILVLVPGTNLSQIQKSKGSPAEKPAEYLLRVHWTVWCAPDSVLCLSYSAGELAALGNRLVAAAKIHRIVRCAPDCPVSQQHPRQWSAAQSAGNAWPEPTVSWRTGLFGVHRTVSGAPRGPRGNGQLRQKRKEIGRRTSTVHVRWCTRLSGAPTGRRQEWPAK